jgi:hypothetical protein
MTGTAIKSFLERLAGGRRSFRDLSMGEAAALSHSASSSWPRGLAKGMRRGQVSPVNKPLKKPAREPRNERKDFMACAYCNVNCFPEPKQ